MSSVPSRGSDECLSGGSERLVDPLADDGCVCDETAVLPQVQLVARRLEIEADAPCRRRASDGPRKATVDRSVQMAAHKPLDLRVTADNGGKSRRVIEAIAVHYR